MTPQQHATILNALTKYDIRASKRKYHNPHALGHYCKALSNCQRHCDNGADLRVAILNCFLDRVLDCVLKSVGLPTSTNEEAKCGGFHRLPELAD